MDMNYYAWDVANAYGVDKVLSRVQLWVSRFPWVIPSISPCYSPVVHFHCVCQSAHQKTSDIRCFIIVNFKNMSCCVELYKDGEI